MTSINDKLQLVQKGNASAVNIVAGATDKLLFKKPYRTLCTLLYRVYCRSLTNASADYWRHYD